MAQLILSIRHWFGSRSVCIVVLAVAATLSPAQDKTKSAATRDYIVAANFQNNGLYELAEKRWRSFIKTHAKDAKIPHAWHHLGACLLKRKKYAEAVQAFRTVVDKFKTFDSRDAAQYNLGLAFYHLSRTSKKKTDYQQAANAFGEVAKTWPKSAHAPRALYFQGECLYAAGDLKGAAAAYEKLDKNYGENAILADALYSLGTTQQELKQHKMAAITFGKFLQKFKKNELAAECRLRRGQSLYELKNYKEAAPEFSQAAKAKDFEYAEFAWMQHGLCLYEQTKYQEAAGVFEELPKRFSKGDYRGPALLAAGKCRFLLGKYDRARPLLQRAFGEKFKEAPEAGYWLGQSLLQMKRPQEAEQIARTALAKFSTSPFAPQLDFVRISGIYAQANKRKSAIAEYAAFAGKYPNHELAPRAQYKAALTALQETNYPAAQKHAVAYLNNPKFAGKQFAADVLFIAGESLLQASEKNHAQAETYFRTLITEHKHHKQALASHVRVGLCLYLAKKHEESIELLRQIESKLRDAELKAETAYLIGRNHTDAGRRTEAISAFEKALTSKPDWKRGDEVLLALAENLRAAKKNERAADRLRKLVGSFAKSELRDQAYYQLGDIEYERGRFNEAAAAYQSVVSQFATSELAGPAQHGIGLAQLSQKKYPAAIAAFSTQISKYTKSGVTPLSQYWRAHCYQRLKQYQPALVDLQAFLKTNPTGDKALDARYSLGLCQASLKQYEPAASAFRALLKDQPKYPQADKVYSALAFVLLETGKEKEAATAFRELAQQFPLSPLAANSWYQVGRIHMANKELNEAAQAYTAGLKTAKEKELEEQLQHYLGWVHYKRGKFSDAADILQKQIKKHAKGKLALDGTFLAGECLFKLNRFKEAGPLFDDFLNKGGKKFRARALYRGGACDAAQKKWAASEKHYAELVGAYKDFELIHEAKYGLGWSKQNQQKFDEAVKIYEAVTKETETETAAKSRFMIGEIAFARKNYKLAVEHFLEAALGYPYKEWQALSYFEAGRCFIELKDIPKAISTLETVVQKHPKHRRAKDAMRLLEDLRKQQSSRRKVGVHALAWVERRLTLKRELQPR